MTITTLIHTEFPIVLGPDQRTAGLCAATQGCLGRATTRVVLKDEDGFMRRVFRACDACKRG